MSVHSLDYLFSDGTPEKFICPQCSQLLRAAVQTNCGHFLCESCAEELFRDEQRNARCPGCGEKLEGEDGTKYFPDRHLRREIQDYPRRCYIDGCPWKGVYKEFARHFQAEHSPQVLKPVPKRKASHAVVDIKHHEATTTAPTIMREKAHQMRQSADDLDKKADNLEQQSKRAEYVERIKVDSLRRFEAGTGAAASNNSLKRAPELFPEDRSSTLDAKAEVHLEVAPVSEYTRPVTQISQQTKHCMVPGVGHNYTSQQLPSREPTLEPHQPVSLPPLSPSVMEQGSHQHQAAIPKLQSSQIEHRSSRPSRLPNPNLLSAGTTPSNNSSRAQSVSPQRRHRRQPSLSPIQVHPPQILQSKCLPLPKHHLPLLSPRIKSKTSSISQCPCPECKQKLQAMRNMFSDLMKAGVIDTHCTGCTCKKLGRPRLESI